MKRDNIWLENRLRLIWQRYFVDLEQRNSILIGFGKRARTRLGSIRYHKKSKTSIITISGYFKNLEIPEFVIDVVLAHELVHYLHGFSSPHSRAWQHPHQGGIVDREMKDRGLEEVLKLQKKWIKKNHAKYFSKQT
ncbi:hypothetical protein ACFL14_02580 [Patescibacteria group bacterium]